MQCDEDCEEAALPLVEEYARTERWQQAEPLAEMLVKKAKNRERHEQHMLYKLLGKVHAALRNHDRALKAYQTANHLDLTDQEGIRGIADMAFELKDWPTALTNYQKVLTALGEEDVEQRTDVYFRLGCIKREQGQAKQAINNFEKALALNGEHRPTLESLIDVYASANDWKQVAAYKRQVLDSIFDGEERYKLLNEIGDIWAEKEKNAPEGHRSAGRSPGAQARRPCVAPQAPAALRRGQRVAEDGGYPAIHRVSGGEAEIKSRYFYTMAQIHRDKLEDNDRAVELFNESLDLNPSYLQAFERINKILTQEKNWKQLERSYRKMLHRIAGKGNADLEHTLWHQLGLIYRDRLQRTDESIEAFKMAASVKPGRDARAPDPGGALRSRRERFDEAIREQRVILELIRLEVEPYRALYRLLLAQADLRRRPGAWPRRWPSWARSTRRRSSSSTTIGRRACWR